MVDYIESITFVTKDGKWFQKLAIGAVMSILSIILVGGWALTGWAMEIFRRTAHGHDEQLADWDDLGGYIGNGLKYAIVTFVWSLPAMAISMAVSGSVMMVGSPHNGDVALAGASLLVSLLSMAYGFVASFVSMGSFAILAETGSLGQAINPANAWAVISRDPGQWIVTGLFLVAASVVLSLAGALVCVVGLLLATPWVYAMTGHLLGQTFAKTGGEL